MSCVSLPFSKSQCEETISAASIERLNVVGASKAMGLRSGALRVHKSEGYLKLDRNKSSPCSIKFREPYKWVTSHKANLNFQV